jgi:hypothetical protein
MDYFDPDPFANLCYWLSIILPLPFLGFSVFFGVRSLFRRLGFISFLKGFFAFPLCWVLVILGQYFLLKVIPAESYFAFNDFLGIVLSAETSLFVLSLALYAILYPIVAVVKWLRLPH